MPRTVRKARNRALLRDVNSEIAVISGTFGGDGTSQGFICECHRLGCLETIQVPLRVYEQLRDDPETFVVLPGHEDLDHEAIVSVTDEYVVVRESR